MKKLIAVFAFSYISQKSGKKTYVYILDGTQEQHDQYLSRIDMQYQPTGGYDDRNGEHPELKGNPAFFSSTFKGTLVEIVIPEDTEKQPRIQSDELDKEFDLAEMTGEDKRKILDKYMKTLNKHRASVKAVTPAEDAVDDLGN